MYAVEFMAMPPKPMRNMRGYRKVAAPKSARGQAWWKIGIATINMGLWCGIFDLEEWGPQRDKPVTIDWTLQGIPARSIYDDAGFDEIGWRTVLWPGSDARVEATGWLERHKGAWLQDGASLVTGATKRRAADLARLRFERPTGYEALGPLLC